jgi:hypothetical protein
MGPVGTGTVGGALRDAGTVRATIVWGSSQSMPAPSTFCSATPGTADARAVAESPSHSSVPDEVRRSTVNLLPSGEKLNA